MIKFLLSLFTVMLIGPKWYEFAKKFEGKKETESTFGKWMSSKWSLFGMNLGTIAKNWAAWCGLFVAVSLSGVGYKYAKDGSLARNWGKYGQEIHWQTDGIPRGAIIHINHNANCKSSSSNHVTLADGDCTIEDLKKSGVFPGYGGNQGNMAKRSMYPVAHICEVRWPMEEKLPAKVTKSLNCGGSSASGESTR